MTLYQPYTIPCSQVIQTLFHIGYYGAIWSHPYTTYLQVHMKKIDTIMLLSNLTQGCTKVVYVV